jgi:hypothetical protein
MKPIIALASLLLVAATDVPAGWTPDLFQGQSTIQFYTTNSDGDGHWSTVWIVVIDGAPYIRLGSRAAGRVEENRDAPYVNVRVGGQEFDHVLAQSAPEMADKVAAAMADKYWMDILVRHESHPLTVRLVPAATPQH